MANTTAEQFAQIVIERLTNGSIVINDESVVFDDAAIQRQVYNDPYWNLEPSTPLWRTIKTVVDEIVGDDSPVGYATLGKLIGTMPFRSTPLEVTGEEKISAYISYAEILKNLAKQAIAAVIDQQINQRHVRTPSLVA